MTLRDTLTPRLARSIGILVHPARGRRLGIVRVARKLIIPRIVLRTCTLSLALLGCGGTGGGDDQTLGNSHAAHSRAPDHRGKLGHENRRTNVTEGDHALLRLSEGTLICAEFGSSETLTQVAAGNEARFVNTVLDELREHFRKNAAPLYATGDTSGSRFRSAAADPRGCSRQGTIRIQLHLSPGPAGKGEPTAGHPRILPYTLKVIAAQGGSQWMRTVSRAEAEAHPSVTNDPHTSSQKAATIASISQDLRDMTQALEISIVGISRA